MSAKRRPWWLDFAGKHGTGWGALNLGLTVVSVTALEHALFRAPWWVAGVMVLTGVIITLGWVAILRPNTAPATVIYWLACWVGAGLWSANMLMWADWNWRGYGARVGILAGATVVAGMLVSLGSRDKSETSAGSVDTSQRSLNAMRDDYMERIHRLVHPGGSGAYVVKIVGIQKWEGGGGHTIEGVFTSGAFGLTQFQALGPRLALDLNLPHGCGVEIYEPELGRRKSWLMNVTTKNVLAVGMKFPVDTAGPWSINGGIPIGFKPNGELKCISLRQRNFAIFGMPGSGKTGGLLATTASLALTADVVMFGFDFTGADLIQPFQGAFEREETERPIFSLVATDPDQGAQMMRAAIRIGHARKMAYDYLKREHGTSLIPIGAEVRGKDLVSAARAHFELEDLERDRIVPQVMVIGDETTEVLRGRNPVLPELSDLMAKGMQELRGSGIRFIVPPLGGDDQYIGQKFQKLIHTIAVLKMDSGAEYRHAIGRSYTIDPKDISRPGQGLVRDEPGQSLENFRFFGEMTPAVIDAVAIRADQIGTLPDLDFVSELAANGFMPDGSPWPTGQIMKREDTGYWARRWDAILEPAASVKVRAKLGERTGDRMSTESVLMLRDDLLGKAAAAQAAVDARKAELARERDEVAEAAEKNWSAIPEWLPELPDVANWREVIMEAIRAAGASGVQMKDLVDLAGKHRSSVHEFLAPKVKALELRSEGGFYSIHPDAI